MAAEHIDVIIIGAGISGIGAAVHLQQHCPSQSYVILERRPNIGGTWDLFRYPGIRSDSDMYTLGFRFKPWTAEKAIADGPTILDYLHKTVEEFGIRDRIRHAMQVTSASWSSQTGLWTVTGVQGAAATPFTLTCNWYFNCTGYYNYDEGFTPDFEGRDDFKGHVIHPQHWPESLDHAGKRIIVIGSGATAVTVVPSLCDTGAGHVTMLQRTPTYMASRPAIDGFARTLQKLLPAKAAYMITRWRNVLMQQFLFNFARKNPAKFKERLLGMVREALGPDYDIKTHFTPPYNPWEQRLCLVPDNDLFRVIKSGQAEIVTDHIARFTEKGILLKSGKALEADIIVTATGLNMQMFAGVNISVDGKPFRPGEHVLYKGIMFNDVPNLAMWFGYTNASWTLKADLTSEYMCRLLNHMAKTGQRIATPHSVDPHFETEQFVDFSSGYFQRAMGNLPKTGTKLPWKLHQNYLKDVKLLRNGPLTDEILFGNPVADAASAAEPLLEAAE